VAHLGTAATKGYIVSALKALSAIPMLRYRLPNS